MLNYLPSPTELKSAGQELIEYIKHPIEQIKTLPHWSWSALVCLCLIVAMSVGAFSGIIQLRITSIIYGAIIYPISTLMIMSIFTAFFYYTLLFFFNQKADIKNLATMCFLAGMPWIVLAPFVDYVPPLSPVGIIFSGMLAIVGLSENFSLGKKSATRLVLILVSVFLVFWVINIIRVAQFSSTETELITPESLDILEQELEGN